MKAHWVTYVLVAVLVAVSCTHSALAGKYISERDRSPKDYVELTADGTFTLQEDGATLTGTYQANGSQVALTTASGRRFSCRVEGTALVDETGTRWTRQ